MIPASFLQRLLAAGRCADNDGEVESQGLEFPTAWEQFQDSAEVTAYRFDGSCFYVDVVPVVLEHAGLHLQGGEWHVIREALQEQAVRAAHNDADVTDIEPPSQAAATRRIRRARTGSTGSGGGSQSSLTCSGSVSMNDTASLDDHRVASLRRQLNTAIHQKTQAKASNRRLRQHVRRQNSLISKLKTQLAVARGVTSSLEVTRVSDTDCLKGKSGSWLTPSGAASLADSRLKMA